MNISFSIFCFCFFPMGIANVCVAILNLLLLCICFDRQIIICFYIFALLSFLETIVNKLFWRVPFPKSVIKINEN